MKGSALKDMTFDGSEAKSLDSTKLNNPTAREHPDHISGTNTQKEYDSGKPSLGKLGHQG